MIMDVSVGQGEKIEGEVTYIVYSHFVACDHTYIHVVSMLSYHDKMCVM